MFQRDKKLRGLLRSPRLVKLGCFLAVKGLVLKRLEPYPQTKLHRPRLARRHIPRNQFSRDAAQCAPIGGIPEEEIRIAQLGMIEDVGEVSVELQMEPLSDQE